MTFIGVWEKHNAVRYRSLTLSPSIAFYTSLKDKVIMDFAFYEISLNINKMGSLSIPKIPNYPQMTFLFCKILIISILYFEV